VSDATHLLIRASAGTGKTFRLTHRFIALLAQGVPPDRVLASTFTRRAAGEILQRLVGRLAQAATAEKERAETNGQLAHEPGARPLDEAGARRVLLALLRDLHRVEVRTLDAFFHQLARVHAWELDLPPGWTLATPVDEARLQSDAVARVLARADQGEISALLAALAGGTPRSSVHAHLLRLLKDAQGLVADSTPAAWTAIGAPTPVSEDELTDAVAQLRAIPLPTTRNGEPRKHWVSNMEALVASAEARDWDALDEIGLVVRVAEGGGVFDSAPIPPALAETIGMLLRASAVARIEKARGCVAAWHRLLIDYDVDFAALQRERRLLRFADVPRALRRGAVPGGDETALALRLDGALQHVLLDEFQDTSAEQWRVVAPLVDRALADPDRHVLVVGDSKQSIFAWRAGEPRLMDVLARRGLAAVHLESSRRSAPAIMEAVNAIFEPLEGSPALGDDALARAAARDWHAEAAFPKHRTECASLRGAVRLWQVATPDRLVGPRAARLAEATADLVAGLVAADASASVGVLVRTKKPIPRLIHTLRERGVLASGDGGNVLIDAEAVQVLLSLLVLADHPGDRAAAFHVGTSPLGRALGVDPRPGASQVRVAAEVRAALLRDGYGAWLERRRADVQACDAFGAWDRRRVAQLVDLGHAWDARATLRPADFVAHVRKTPVEDPASARVRVLTVHASKGLEFDAVVCPELEFDPLRRNGEAGLVAGRTDPEQPIDTIFLDLSPEVAQRAGHDRLLDLLNEARLRDLREELCVLYVALTRARRRLDLLVSTADPPASSFAAIVRQALERADAPVAPPTEGCVLLREIPEQGAPADPLLAVQAVPAPEPAASPPVAAPAPAEAAVPLAWRRDGERRVLRRSAPSSREGGGRRRASELLQRDGDLARRRGSLVHAWLADVTWMDEALPSIDAQRETARRHLLRAGLSPAEVPLDDWLSWLRAALERPGARELLSRAPAAARAGVPASAVPELWLERGFLHVDREASGDEILVPGAFDRVVLWRDADGSLLAAEIVDFKTDRFELRTSLDADLRARAGHYAPQMQAYHGVLRARTSLPPSRIACRLLFLEADAVVDVPPLTPQPAASPPGPR